MTRGLIGEVAVRFHGGGAAAASGHDLAKEVLDLRVPWRALQAAPELRLRLIVRALLQQLHSVGLFL